MKKQSIRAIDLHFQLQTCLNQNTAKYVGNQSLIAAASTLDSRIELERQMQKELEVFLIKTASVKADARTNMANLSDAMRRRVQGVYALADREKFLLANITYSDVAYGAYLTGISRAQNVYDMANALTVAQKTSANVTALNLTELNNAIEACTNLNPSTRRQAVLRKNMNKNFREALKQTTKFIHDTLDSLMGDYRVSDSSFYSEWLMSREFINAASSHAQIIGTVTGPNGTPLRNVKVKATNGIKVYEDVTDKKGNYKIPVSPELYNITFDLTSYTSAHVNEIFVDAAEREIVNTRLVPATN